MVKNEKGGKGAKSLARKATGSGGGAYEQKLRFPSCSLEQFACVTKLFGNGMCEIITNDRVTLMGHIRSKFSGRQKRNNMITRNSIVLIGLREWEKPEKNCDILCIYDDHQIEQLKINPQVDIKHVVYLKNNGALGNNTKPEAFEEIRFSNETEEDTKQMLAEVDEFEMQNEEEVDIEDI